jgi:hypothetical protein
MENSVDARRRKAGVTHAVEGVEWLIHFFQMVVGEHLVKQFARSFTFVCVKAASVRVIASVVEVSHDDGVTGQSKGLNSCNLIHPSRFVRGVQVGVQYGELVVREFVSEPGRNDVALVDGIRIHIVAFGSGVVDDSNDAAASSAVRRGEEAVTRENRFEAGDKSIVRESNVLEAENRIDIEKRDDKFEDFTKVFSNATSLSSSKRVNV